MDLGLNVFFDESGKDKNKPHLMGALALPERIYRLPIFNELREAISMTEIHWKKYDGDGKERRIITKMIKTLCDFEKLARMNIFNYDQSVIQLKGKD